MGFAIVSRKSQGLSARDPAELGGKAVPAALGREPILQGKATSSLRQAFLSSAVGVRGPSVRSPFPDELPGQLPLTSIFWATHDL